MSLEELGIKRKRGIASGLFTLFLLAVFDVAVLSILPLVLIAPPGIIGLILALNAFFIYTILLHLSSKVVFFAFVFPTKKLGTFMKHIRTQFLILLLAAPGFLILVYGVLQQSVTYQWTGLQLVLPVFVVFLMWQYARYALFIAELVGEIRPKKDLVNNMIYNLPYLTFVLGMFLFLYVSPLLIDPRVLTAVFSAVGVLLYLIYVEIPFMRGRARWKKRELGRLYRERKELEGSTAETSRSHGSKKKHIPERMLKEMNTQLELIRNSMQTKEVNESPNHPYPAVVTFAGAVFSAVLLLAVEWVLFLL